MKTAVGDTKIRERTHYQVLGVSEDATRTQIRRAWRSLVVDNHPDRETEEEAIRAATVRTQQINEAYNTLSSPPERQRYDNDLFKERYGKSAGASPGAAVPEGYEEDEDAYWEREAREAEEEAEAAWSRWENPPASQRLTEALAELRGFDFSSVSLLGAYDDYLDARLGFEKGSLDDSGRPKTTIITAVMAALTVGELVVMASILLGSGAPLAVALLSAVAVDLVLTGLGARPLVLLAAKGGADIALSEGGKLAAWAALAVRALWAGPVALFAGFIVVFITGAVVGLFEGGERLAELMSLALQLVPPVWTAAFLVVWVVRKLAADGTDQE